MPAADRKKLIPANPTETEPAPSRAGFDPTRNRAFLASLAVLLCAVGVVIVVKSRSQEPFRPATAPPRSTSQPPLALGTGPPDTFSTETVTIPEAEQASAPAGPDELPSRPFLAITPVADGPFAIFESPGGTMTHTLTNPKTICNSDTQIPLVLLVKQTVPGGWYEVYLPERPNGRTGFVRATDTKTHLSHSFHIEVRLADFNLKAFDGDRIILDAPIAIASDETPTPPGTYFTTELIRPIDNSGAFNPNGPYGSYAYGLSGFSEALAEFGGCPGQLGIHGTNQPELMGQKVSHGCIRLRNPDIEKLALILPLGVPVQVFA